MICVGKMIEILFFDDSFCNSHNKRYWNVSDHIFKAEMKKISHFLLVLRWITNKLVNCWNTPIQTMLFLDSCFLLLCPPIITSNESLHRYYIIYVYNAIFIWIPFVLWCSCASSLRPYSGSVNVKRKSKQWFSSMAYILRLKCGHKTKVCEFNSQ